jgi:flagellar biosynthesis GTPase FlhF
MARGFSGSGFSSAGFSVDIVISGGGGSVEYVPRGEWWTPEKARRKALKEAQEQQEAQERAQLEATARAHSIEREQADALAQIVIATVRTRQGNEAMRAVIAQEFARQEWELAERHRAAVEQMREECMARTKRLGVMAVLALLTLQ